MGDECVELTESTDPQVFIVPSGDLPAELDLVGLPLLDYRK